MIIHDGLAYVAGHCQDGVMLHQTIMRAPNFIARHGKLEILNELNLGQDLIIFNRCLAFFALVR